MKLATIINIQRFSLHDGNGIRTTVFFKGCPLSCAWCHNPESRSYKKELMYYSERCVMCERCISVCQQKALSIDVLSKDIAVDRDKCIACGRCTDYCLKEALEVAGKEYSASELTNVLVRDRMFYDTSGGGITLSGGEAMTQNIDYLEELVKKLEHKGIGITVDTCGQAPFSSFERILPYIDTFLYDIKLMDTVKHKEYMGSGNELILDNLIKLSNAGGRICLRVPLVDGANATDVDIDSIIDFVKSNSVKVEQVNLLAYHMLGQDKMERLGLEIPDGMKAPSEKRMNEIMEKFKAAGFSKVLIGG